MNRPEDSIQADDTAHDVPADLSCYDDPRVVDALEQYLARCEDGDRPSRQEFLAAHPQVAGQLADCLDGLEFVHGLAPQLREESQADAGPQSLPETEPIPVALGDFRINREIGRGGMGVVYEATQLSLARRVALKVLPFAAVLDQRQLQRFKNEAQAAATLHHNHIVPVFSVGCERGVHDSAMQYIEGHSLAQVVQQLRGVRHTLAVNLGENAQGVATQTETRPVAALTTHWSSGSPEFYRGAAQLVRQAAEALQYAHQEGVLHRDIKPSNLLVDHQGHLWVTDFGLAQVQGNANLTMTGDVLGTLRYMSPEQAAGTKLLDHRTDVYSLGATLYELVTLQPAFAVNDRARLLREVAEEIPRPPRQNNRQVPADLETIVLKAMAKEPESRYHSAQEFSDDLRRFLERRPVRARRSGRLDRLRRWVHRNPTLAILLSVIAVLMTALAAGGPVMALKQSRLAAAEAAARKKAEQARDAADAAREQADRSRRNAHEVLGRVLRQTATTLRSMQPVQRQLLEETVRYYHAVWLYRCRISAVARFFLTTSRMETPSTAFP